MNFGWFDHRKMSWRIWRLNALFVSIHLLIASTADCQRQGFEVCEDIYQKSVCEAFKQKKICKYVTRSCRKTCDTCTPCSDKSSACPSFAKLRYCRHSEFYRNYCALSCRVCAAPPKPVPKWEEWGRFSPCSVTCGTGSRKRSRRCLFGDCVGPTVETLACQMASCPFAQWNDWGPYASCSATCGPGYKFRTRTCTVPNKCIGSDVSYMPCSITSTCRGHWEPWGPYSACSTTCGRGVQSRYRVCSGGKNCEGPAMSRKPCKGPICTTSGGWSECTKTCGTGTRYRFDSENCKDENSPKCFRTFEECNIRECPQKSCKVYETRRYNDTSCCKISEWGQCGRSFLQSRIINGRRAKRDQWPWMALLIIRGALCGGTLISKEWILTAGHCVKDGQQYVSPKQVKIYLGITKISERTSKNLYLASRIIPHPKYDDLKFDIALIKLTKPLRRDAGIPPVCLPQGETPPIDSTCIATGWGLTSADPPTLIASDPLMEVKLQNFDINVCRKSYAEDEIVGKYVLNTDNMLCAGSLSKATDVCRGDSGGPLLCQRCESCTWYIAGVTSFGPKGTCGKPGFPGMYTKVAMFENWIFNHVPSLKGREHSCTGNT